MRIILGLAALLVATSASAQPLVAPHVVDIHAAAPGVLAVTLESVGQETGPNNTPDTIDLTAAHWTVNGTAALSVSRNSQAWDEDKRAANGSLKITVHHRIYLQISSALQNGTTYTVGSPYGSFSITYRDAFTWCESIKVNQVGYAQGTTVRYANFGVWQGSGGTMSFSAPLNYQVLRSDGSMVFQGQSSDQGTDPLAGEHVYRLSLASVPDGGPYQVMVPSCGVSRPFGIGAAYVEKAFETIMRFFLYQRCGDPIPEPYAGGFSRATCHSQLADTRTALGPDLQKPSPYGITIPAGMATSRMRGSWHDAGNFQRRPQHANIPPALMTLYEAYPDHFADCQYSIPIPECGNGIPDFLDEALYGVLGWEFLQIKDGNDPLDGCVRSGTMEQSQPNYGVDSSENNPQVIGSFAVTDYATLRAAGMFAQGSRLLQKYDVARASQMRTEALNAYGCLLRTKPATFFTTPDAGLLYASGQMYQLTGDPSYHTTFHTQASALLVPLSNGQIPGTYPQQYLAGNPDVEVKEYHFASYLLDNPAQPVDTALRDTLRGVILSGAASGGYMKPPPEASGYPYGANKFYPWGHTTAQGIYARPYTYASLWVPAATAQIYRNYESEYADHSLGLTPEGQSYYTGLGTDQPRSPLHLDSYFPKFGVSDGVSNIFVGAPKGNIPGLLVYGPNDAYPGVDYQVAATNKFFPNGLSRPIYHQYLHAWSSIIRNEFTMHETIEPNAELFASLLPSLHSVPPANDAGPDAAVDASADVALEASSDAKTDTGVDATALVCIQPPPVICGPLRDASGL